MPVRVKTTNHKEHNALLKDNKRTNEQLTQSLSTKLQGCKGLKAKYEPHVEAQLPR